MTKERFNQLKGLLFAWDDISCEIGTLDQHGKEGPRNVNPTEFANDDYVMYLDDSYADMRRHLLRGNKVMFFSTITGEWKEVSSKNAAWREFDHFRAKYKCVVKPDWISELKVGDTIVHVGASSNYTVLRVESDGLENEYFFEQAKQSMTEEDIRNNDFKMWEPTKGEVCFFWGNATTPTLATFKRGTVGNHSTNKGNFENCRPYEGTKFWEEEA